MSENKDLHEENLNSEQEFNPNIEEETVENVTKKETYKVHAPISKEDVEILMAGGALNYIRNQQ